MALYDKRFWIFDLDGTLTVPVHDFDEIRRMLGLPGGKGILEALAELEESKRLPLVQTLDDYEYELASKSVAAPGAAELLADLTSREIRIGIVTRNNLRNLERTLQAAELDEFIDPAFARTRENTKPKPHPDGILQLMDYWQAAPSDTVMVGNHLVDPATSHNSAADLNIRTLAELARIRP
jgi:phosphoglycolate phosphatase-like HAD superfamily hydrolase